MVSPTASGIRLKSIDLHCGIYLARLDVHITVTPDGLLTSHEINNKSYGGNDVSPKYEQHEIRRGRLTPEQMRQLADLFSGWDALSDKPYPGVPDDAEIVIRYGEKTVTGCSNDPQQFPAIYAQLKKWSAQMPVVETKQEPGRWSRPRGTCAWVWACGS